MLHEGNCLKKTIAFSLLQQQRSDLFVAGAKAYRIEYGVQDVDKTSVLNVSATQTEITSLQSGAQYWFVVKAVGEQDQLSSATRRVIVVTSK